MAHCLRRTLALGAVIVASLLGTILATTVSAVSTTLVINEFRTRGPNGGLDEFIEIRNVSGGGINLSGWNVLGSDGSGLQQVRATLPNVVLGAGCSWLLGNAQPSGYGGPVDQPYTIDIPDDGGIALQAPGGGIADALGLSVGSAFGEGVRLEPLATDTNRSYERGSADTDNNWANFVLRNPSTPTGSSGCTPAPPTPTPPTISATATPPTVNNGATVLIRATVIPGSNPASTGLEVLVDASTIGAVTLVQLVDDGTNGDQTAGDLVFSRNVSVAVATPAGTKSIPVGVADAQGRSASAFLSLVVNVGVPPSLPPTAVLNSGPFGRLSTALVSTFVTPGANPTSTGLRVVLNLTPLGGGAATELANGGGGLCDSAAGDVVFTACLELPPSVLAGPIVLTGTVSDAQGRTSALSFNTSVNAGIDSDGDGLLDSFEGCFGLDMNSGAGDDGPSGDPDGDGLTNLQEQSAGTHPRGFFTRYLAEGVTNAFFQTRIGLFDVGSPQGTTTNIRLQPEGLPERSFCTFVPRLMRRTLTPEDTATFGSAPFATVVESDHELVVDRTMMWGAGFTGATPRPPWWRPRPRGRWPKGRPGGGSACFISCRTQVIRRQTCRWITCAAPPSRS